MEIQKKEADGTLSVQEAKLYFETHASDLRQVNLNLLPEHTHSNSSRTSAQSLTDIVNNVIAPDWSEAVRTTSGQIDTWEVPLVGELTETAVVTDGRAKDKRIGLVISRLIIQKSAETKNIRYFVVTMIPDRNCLPENPHEVAGFHYMNNPSFSGLAIISDVTGRYIDSYLYKPEGMIPVNLKQSGAGNETETGLMDFVMNPAVKSVTYSTREGGWGKECPNCHSIYYGDMCRVCNGLDIPPIVVYPGTKDKCPYCGYNPCRCCEICNQYPCICKEWRCPYCGSPYCNGSCQGTGGSIGGGGGGTGSGNQFNTTKMKTAAKNAVKKVIDKYGPNIAACNIGVINMFREMTGSNELDGMKANEMIDYWEYDPGWKSITMDMAQDLANQGYFVVAGLYGPVAGHVVVVVPGEMASSKKWGGKVPVVMDTGSRKRNEMQGINYSWNGSCKDKIKFYIYNK